MRGITSWHREALAAALLLCVLPLAGAAQDRPSGEQDQFSHRRHAGLFPLCTGCHTGIPEDDREQIFPDASVCSNCHNGTDEPRIDWSGPSPEPNNLKFSHPQHWEVAEEQGLDCASCHSDPDARRMESVHLPRPQTCLNCHVPDGPSHFEVNECAECHVPLAESGFGLARLEALEAPPDHMGGTFLASTHGIQAAENTQRCATCHTQDRCASCHVNAGWLEEVQAVPAAPADMALPVAAVHYSTPGTHDSWSFVDSHGQLASRDACSTCHTRDDCTACHVSPAPGSATDLPRRPQVVAPGVGLEREMPATHQSSAFLVEIHGTAAASDAANCASCHTEESCILCHDATRAPTYHPANFVLRHAAPAYGQTLECQACHSQEEFCRACHVQQGITARGRLGPGYHDGQAAWLFQHGKAARQQLETCTSCHTQGECMQCHSSKGAFKISPHGPDFDPELAAKKNAQICLACHTSPPIGN